MNINSASYSHKIVNHAKSYISLFVPTVDLGFVIFIFCSMAIEGEIPIISSTSGLFNFPINCLAYEERLSIYRLWPSAYNVSNASEDLPEPDKPVITVNLFLGISTLMFFKLCNLAPLINMLFFEFIT